MTLKNSTTENRKDESFFIEKATASLDAAAAAFLNAVFHHSAQNTSTDVVLRAVEALNVATMSLLAKNLIVSATILNDPTRPFTHLELLRQNLEDSLKNFEDYRKNLENTLANAVNTETLH